MKSSVFGVLVMGALVTAAPVVAQSSSGRAISGAGSSPDTMRDYAFDQLIRELDDAGVPRITKRDGRWPANTFPKLPRDRPAILFPNLSPPDQDGVPGWIKRNEQVQIPAGPRTAAENINTTARSLAASCSALKKDCDEAVAFGSVVSALRMAAGNHPDCDSAAKAYAKDYHVTDPPDAVAAAYDAACLGSLSARYRGGAPVASEPLPAVFTGGADGAGALSAVAILQVDDKPFCGGLLRNDRTVVTARHCVDRYLTAYQARRVTVRSAKGTQTWPVDWPATSAGSTQLVRDDWTVLKLGGTAPVAVVATTLAKFDIAEALTLVGSFSRYGLMDYQDQSEAWRRSLRYPRAGMCHGLVVENGCLVLTCQTVPGFSGAPIFKVASGGAMPTVVGFVSGTLSATTGCPAAGPFPTLAASADRIR